MAAIKLITVLATPTTVLEGLAVDQGGVFAPVLWNVSAETITLDFEQSTDDLGLAPGEAVHVPQHAKITATAAGGAASLLILSGVSPAGGSGVLLASFDETTGSLQITRLNPEWAHTGPIQQTESGLGDGTVTVYFDMEGYQHFQADLDVTAGTGTWAWKVYSATQNDGTAEDSVQYTDRTLQWFGATSFITSVDAVIPLEKSTPTAVKFVKLEGVRSGDVGSSGAYTADVQRI